MLQAQLITDDIVKLRAEYLSRRGQELEVKAIKNPNLEDWFQNDPVEKIVRLEPGIRVKKRERELAEASRIVNTRAVSPVIRFEDEDIEEMYHNIEEERDTLFKSDHEFSCESEDEEQKIEVKNSIKESQRVEQNILLPFRLYSDFMYVRLMILKWLIQTLANNTQCQMMRSKRINNNCCVR